MSQTPNTLYSLVLIILIYKKHSSSNFKSYSLRKKIVNQKYIIYIASVWNYVCLKLPALIFYNCGSLGHILLIISNHEHLYNINIFQFNLPYFLLVLVLSKYYMKIVFILYNLWFIYCILNLLAICIWYLEYAYIKHS